MIYMSYYPYKAVKRVDSKTASLSVALKDYSLSVGASRS